jgi:hypothetical protein
VEPSCAASASSSRPDRRRNRAARLLQRRRLQQHCSLLGPEPVDHVVARQGMGRIWSACAHTRPGRSFHTHSEKTDVPQVCATAAALASPSAKSLVIPTVSLPVQSTARDEHPVIGVVQHFGGWRLLSEGLGRCPRRASSSFHPKRQTPFRVKGEREDGVAFSAPEKPPDACTPAARREGRVAAQCCATTRRRKQ